MVEDGLERMNAVNGVEGKRLSWEEVMSGL